MNVKNLTEEQKKAILCGLYEAKSESEALLKAAIQDGIAPENEDFFNEIRTKFEKQCEKNYGLHGMRFDLFFD